MLPVAKENTRRTPSLDRTLGERLHRERRRTEKAREEEHARRRITRENGFATRQYLRGQFVAQEEEIPTIGGNSWIIPPRGGSSLPQETLMVAAQSCLLRELN